jgi:hypothetical protein
MEGPEEEDPQTEEEGARSPMISTTKKPATKTAPNLEPEGLRLVRAVLDHFAAPPREVQMLFVDQSGKGLVRFELLAKD